MLQFAPRSIKYRSYSRNIFSRLLYHYKKSFQPFRLLKLHKHLQVFVKHLNTPSTLLAILVGLFASYDWIAVFASFFVIRLLAALVC